MMRFFKICTYFLAAFVFAASAQAKNELPATIESWLDISNVQASTRRILGTTELKLELLKTTHKAAVTDQNVMGYSFIGESTILIKAFEDLVRGATPDQIDVNEGCHKVICAVERIFSSGVGVRLLAMRVFYGYNGSHLAVQDFTVRGSPTWQLHELDQLLVVLADAPFLSAPYENRRLLRDNRIDRFRKSLVGASRNAKDILAINSKDPAVGIRVSEAWTRLKGAQKRAAILHELVHDMVHSWEKNDLDLMTYWSRIASQDDKASGKRGARVSHYAHVNADEDLAESAIAYRYFPQFLRRRSPGRYKFLREHVFHGVEYQA